MKVPTILEEGSHSSVSLRLRPKLGDDVEAREGSVDVEEECFAVGDKVAIKVSENVLVELQEDYGGCTEGMTQVIP